MSDTSAPAPSTGPSWGPNAVAAALLGLVGSGFLATAALGRPDAAGQLLLGLAGAVAVLAAVHDVVARPRLALTDGGLLVRGPFGRRRFHAAPDVTAVRLLEYPRLGRRTRLLEIECRTAAGDEQLLLFSRRELGVWPADVLAVLADAGLPVVKPAGRAAA